MLSPLRELLTNPTPRRRAEERASLLVETARYEYRVSEWAHARPCADSPMPCIGPQPIHLSCCIVPRPIRCVLHDRLALFHNPYRRGSKYPQNECIWLSYGTSGGFTKRKGFASLGSALVFLRRQLGFHLLVGCSQNYWSQVAIVLLQSDQSQIDMKCIYLMITKMCMTSLPFIGKQALAVLAVTKGRW